MHPKNYKPHLSAESGRTAENQAATYLLNGGYNILNRNFRAGPGEIDIIAEKDDFIVFVEVKANTKNEGIPALERVTKGKIRRITETADIFMQKFPVKEKHIRFDIITVTNDDIVHLENAFDLNYLDK